MAAKQRPSNVADVHVLPGVERMADADRAVGLLFAAATMLASSELRHEVLSTEDGPVA